ncbi:MAG TPA: hypothetical protein VGN51_24260 [Acidimicrobiia bacterium]|jgi:hypothetical protein
MARRERGQQRDGADLCLRCGLCCDGTVFGRITIEPDEEEFVLARGLSPSYGDDGTFASPQPCPAFVDGCCALFERGRPKTCITYTCGLLRGYTEGTAAMDDCLGVVRLVRSLAHELEDEMGLPLGSYSRARLNQHLAAHAPQEDLEHHESFLVAFHRLMALGVKYFDYNPQPEETAAADAGSEAQRRASSAGTTSSSS